MIVLTIIFINISVSWYLKSTFLSQIALSLQLHRLYLLKCIQLSMMQIHIRSSLFISQLLADLENSPMFADDLECQKLLMEAMKYHLLPERRSMMQSPRTKPRKSTVGALYAVGGMDATKGKLKYLFVLSICITDTQRIHDSY